VKTKTSRLKIIWLLYLFLSFSFTPIAGAISFSVDSNWPIESFVGWRSVDSDHKLPARGGTRFAPNVNQNEVEALKEKINPIISNDLYAFMSQDAKSTSDVTLTITKPSPVSYLDWRDISWKDPFVDHGQLAQNLSSPTTMAQNSHSLTSDSSMKLELKMPSSTSIRTSDSFDDMRDPFASSSDAPDMSDPFEGYNRFMFDFNEGFYDNVMEPIVREYRDSVNENFRIGISNVFDNAMAPLKLASTILQGDIEKSTRVIGRTIINTTLGLGGLFDVADKAFDIKDVNEDLDQVLGSYGVPTGPYVMLPLFGPSSLRNIIGRAGGMFLSPTFHFAPGVEVGGALTVTEQVNDTSFIVDDIEQLEESTIDKYESVRDFYGQYRDRLVKE